MTETREVDATRLSRDPAALAAELVRREPLVPATKVRVVRAPGRVNLIGEHTDYNDGLVLPAAIDLGLSIAFAPTADRSVVLTRLDTGAAIELDLDRIGPPDGTWADYVAGMAWSLARSGAVTNGFRGVLAADLPIGAGLSSSAALELAAAWALAGGEPPLPDAMDLARAARRAENDHVGVPCGLMDQFAVTCGVAGAALLLDCRTEQHDVVPLPDGVEIVICHSGVPRRLAQSGYDDRRRESARALEELKLMQPAVTSLRDVDNDLLARAQPGMDPVLYGRVRHVVSENLRVAAVADAMRTRDLGRLAPLFAAAQASLRDDFEVSTPELDRLVDLAAEVPGVLGSRLTGAGFGGATVTLVQRDAAERLVEHLGRSYRTPAGEVPAVHRVRPASGAGLTWSAT